MLDGSTWQGGLTANFTLTNSGIVPLADWSLSFESDVLITGAPWGLSFTVNQLSSGHYAYTLTGTDWGAALAPGGSGTVGFNATSASTESNGILQPSTLFLTSPVASVLQSVPSTVSLPLTPSLAPVITASVPVKGVGQNYAEALQKSFLFYEAQRSGNLDEATNRIDWRGDSGLRDGADGIYFGDNSISNLQSGLKLDLSGGYHDAGDYGKFGLPLASSLTNLAWGGLQFSKGYAISGQTDDLLAAVKWGTDYLLKCNVLNSAGKTAFFVAQVGDPDADHALWQSAESETILRPALAVTASKPGSDVAGGSAAALASASILFRQNGDQAYADQLLKSAIALYDFADQNRGKYSDSIPSIQNFYNSYSGYYDELANGAVWLSKAVSAAGQDGSAYLGKALSFYNSNIGGLNKGWTGNWDDASYATAVLLAEQTGSTAIKQQVEGWLNNWVTGGNGVSITAGGLRWVSQWGSLRYAANTAFLADVYAAAVNDPNGAYAALAQSTVDYILGSNPRNSSYLVGYGNNFPQQPHSRAASGVGWDGFRNGLPNAHINFGALVGGPVRPDDMSYTDSRSDYVSNEVALDYNAGLAGAFARSVELKGGVALTDQELDAFPGISVRMISPVAPTPTAQNLGVALVTVAGAAAVGKVLTAVISSNDPDGNGSGGLTYQWQSSGDGGKSWSAISGAMSSAWTVGRAQEGQAIQVKVLYQDAKNFAETISSAPVLVPYVNDGQVSFAISGTPAVGQILTSNRTASDPDGDGLFRYQWQSQAAGNSTWQMIAGANTSSFQATTAQQGQSLRLQVAYQDQQGFTETVSTSSVSIPVPTQVAVAISGMPSVPTASSPDLKVGVTGSVWYQGLTAQITVTNTGASVLGSWSLSFDTTHVLSGAPWGCTVAQTKLGGGVYRTTLKGADWGSSLAAGASVSVGFNATQGIGLGGSGNLTGPGLFATSTDQLASIAGNPAYTCGNASANVLRSGNGADVLTGLGGADVFQVSSASLSLLAGPDWITDFAIGIDILDGPTAVAASQIVSLGSVASLTGAGVAAQLNGTTFRAQQVATFTYGTGPSTRTFVAFNDGVAGFQSATDGVVEITGYGGDLRNLSVI
ncbi:glycoside hydrolase family 9 protein [Cyanobium sp. HWJ4-Hawea]|uniref:glycoside hydrolase family 9 protein n=1 Tax=Cyanobium sp. HWJ4-Hawea TaxID=2823713 RepID=UPI0020CC9B6E|nr:glycoside hydrolase family 9 protein [Cyanobium sp. HWJ4-Hawea]